MIQRLLYVSQADLNINYGLCPEHTEKIKKHFSGTTEITFDEFDYCDVKKCKSGTPIYGFVPEKKL